MTTRRRLLCGMALFASAAALALPAQADIRVGVVLSTTGPAAAIGIPSKHTVQMWPATIGGQRAQVIVLDDASDPSMAVRNVRKLIAEDKVDVIVGPTIVPTALASLDAVAEGQTPMVTLAASASIVEPQDAKRRWAFKMPQNDSQMATLVTQHMADNGVHTVGFIGFTDAYGESWWREFSKLADVRKLRVVANERFARTDTSVTGQILKLMAAKPDAILIAGAGTPAWRASCRPATRCARSPWNLPIAMKPSTVPTPSRSSRAMHGARGSCSTTPRRGHSRAAPRPARPPSAPPCATRWKRRAI